MRVAIEHTTRLEYDTDVVEAVMDARLGPFSDRDQRWEAYELSVEPTAAVRRYVDGFGNAAHLITLSKPHQFIQLVSRGEIETFLEDPFVPPPAPPEPLAPLELADYLAPSSMVQPHPELEAMAAAYRPSSPSDAFDAVRRLTGVVHDGFTYKQNVTSVATTVPEVLASRTGVCQDFAHILIGLCRSIGVPARYVSGYTAHHGQEQHQASTSQSQSQSQRQTKALSPDGPSLNPSASHAWIEAYTPTHGWRGFDPTNNLVASANHIKMAIGRDYGDVPPSRGTFRGAAEERLFVNVVTKVTT